MIGDNQSFYKVQVTFRVPANDAEDAREFGKGIVGLAKDVVAPFAGYETDDLSGVVDNVTEA